MANVINNNMLALLKGDKGDGLEIKKWYASTEEMNADYSNPDIAVGDCVAINNTLDLYVKGASAFESKGTLKGDKGDTGAAGQDGATPEIGENGNWFIGGVDTEKPSQGATISSVRVGRVITGGTSVLTGIIFVRSDGKELNEIYVRADNGDKGDKGDTGAKGATGADGVSITGATLTAVTTE